MSTMENAYALVIGIADYWHINKLSQTVVKDAEDINQLLIDPQHCGYSPENVHLLTNDSASRELILEALAKLAERISSKSTVFLYISSHGGRIETGPDAGEYFLPVDAKLVRDEDSQWRLQVDTAISNAEFTAAIEAIKAQKVLIVLDCCYAAGIAKDTISGAVQDLPFKKGFTDEYLDTLVRGKGWIILASSRNTEQSYVMSGDGNSLFTKHMLAGLKGGVSSTDGYVRVFQLFEYLQPRVTGDQPEQHPIFKSELEENFAVARHPGGKKEIVIEDAEGYLYDAYISYADQEPDAGWVWQELVPRLKDAGIRIAISGVVEDPTVWRVVEVERAIETSRRTLIIVTENYLTDNLGHFQMILAHHKGVMQRKGRVLPLLKDKIDRSKLPGGLEALTMLDLAHPYYSDENLERLPDLLKRPLAKA